ncbi:hypothetical protein Tco_1531630 [Tanacetum coccineum]
MVAYLEKIVGNAEFHEIIYFLHQPIHYALTVSPVVSTTFVEQFWMTAKSKIINNVRYITATVAGKPVSISEASIRSDLQLNDVAGIDVLSNHAIFDTIQLMGYEGDLNTLTFNKGLFSPQFYNFSKLIFDGNMRHLDAKKKFVMYPRFIPVLLTNQLKNVPVSLDHFPINALTTKVFSFMVKKGKKNSGNVTPLFPSMLVQPIEDAGEVSERPSESQPTPSPTHPREDQIEPQPDPSLRPSSSNLIPNSIPEGSGGNHRGQSSSDRSLSGNEDGLTLQSLKKKAKPVITHHNAWIKSVSIKKRLAMKKSMKKKLMQKESVSKQGRTPAKSKPTVHKDPAFDDLNDTMDDAMDYMETEDAQDEGRTSSKILELSLSGDTMVLEEKESEEKGVLAEPKEWKIQMKCTPTMTSTPTQTFNWSIITLKPLPKIDPKAKGKRKIEEEDESDIESEDITKAEKKFKMLANDEEIARKVQEEWEAEENKKRLAEEEATMAAFTNEEKFTIEQRAKFLHDTIAAQRRFLAQQRSKAIRNKLPIRNQLRNQMMTYLKHVGGYKHAQLNKKKFEEIQVMYEKVKRENERFIPIGSAEDDKLIEKMNKKAVGMDKEEVAKELESSKVEGPKENIKKRSGRRLKMKDPKRMDLIEIHSLVMKKFETTPPEGIDLILWGDLRTMFESKEDDELWKNQEEWKLQSWIFYENYRVHVLRLEDVVSDDDTVFDLLRFIMQQIDEFRGQDGIQKQTAFGKDKSNPLIVDSLLKTIRLSIHLVVYNEELAIPEQTATGKGISNPLMAGCLPKTTKPT